MLNSPSLAESPAHAAFVSGSEPASAQSPATSPASAGSETASATPASAPAEAQSAGQQAAAAATAAGATPAQADAAKQQAIAAMLDGKPYELNSNVQLPYKRGNETVYFPVSEVLRFHMNHKDYTQGKARNDERQQSYERSERELLARQAAFEARQEALSEERERWEAAYSGDDPEASDRYRRHLELMRSDPDYKQMHADAMSKRERDAEDRVGTELTRYDESQAVAQDLQRYIVSFGQKHFPGIEPELVQQMYGEALSNGELAWPEATGEELDEVLRTLVPQQLRQLFQREADQRNRYTKPMAGELDALRAELAAMRNEQTAGAHNGRTRQAIARSRNPIGAPVGGTPPTSGSKRPPQPFTSDERDARTREWARG